MKAEWIFDPTPPSGLRRGGNAAEYGFEEKIDTLVRIITSTIFKMKFINWRK